MKKISQKKWDKPELDSCRLTLVHNRVDHSVWLLSKTWSQETTFHQIIITQASIIPDPLCAGSTKNIENLHIGSTKHRHPIHILPTCMYLWWFCVHLQGDSYNILTCRKKAVSHAPYCPSYDYEIALASMWARSQCNTGLVAGGPIPNYSNTRICRNQQHIWVYKYHINNSVHETLAGVDLPKNLPDLLVNYVVSSITHCVTHDRNSKGAIQGHEVYTYLQYAVHSISTLMGGIAREFLGFCEVIYDHDPPRKIIAMRSRRHA